MTIAQDIINLRVPDLDLYVREGNSLDDIDEYGFTPLIESVITRQINIGQMLIERGVDINKPDVTGRTALHWAVDNGDLTFIKLLLKHGAAPNAYTHAGLSVLVYPVLRAQNQIKHLLYQYGAKLDFALDFIYGKLIGHRFELRGDVDIVNAQGEFIELDYEGFILEFTVAIIKDSLRRFTSSFSTRHLRHQFLYLYSVMDALTVADELLQFQHHVTFNGEQRARLSQIIEQTPLLVLPAASRGHAIAFVRYRQWWAKIDRGENSLKEGSINIYQITRPEALDVQFLNNFLYKKQPRSYFHQVINQILGLVPRYKIPMSSQIAGNCSWANIQAVVAVGYALQQLEENHFSSQEVLDLYHRWVTWDQDRALDECIQRFYAASAVRRASFASMLAAVLFNVCDERDRHDLERAEKILAILTLPEYYYILQSYLDIYCVKRLTRKGNNLLKLLDDCGHNPNIGVSPIATRLEGRGEKD